MKKLLFALAIMLTAIMVHAQVTIQRSTNDINCPKAGTILPLFQLTNTITGKAYTTCKDLLTKVKYLGSASVSAEVQSNLPGYIFWRVAEAKSAVADIAGDTKERIIAVKESVVAMVAKAGKLKQDAEYKIKGVLSAVPTVELSFFVFAGAEIN